jgi:hypothetical protein
MDHAEMTQGANEDYELVDTTGVEDTTEITGVDEADDAHHEDVESTGVAARQDTTMPELTPTTLDE